MLLVEADGVILTANPAARRMLVAAGGAVEGRNLAELAADDPEKVFTYLRMCARTRQMLPGTIALRWADGAEAARHHVHGMLLARPSETDRAAVLLRIEEASAQSRFALLTEKID